MCMEISKYGHLSKTRTMTVAADTPMWMRAVPLVKSNRQLTAAERGRLSLLSVKPWDKLSYPKQPATHAYTNRAKKQ